MQCVVLHSSYCCTQSATKRERKGERKIREREGERGIIILLKAIGTSQHIIPAHNIDCIIHDQLRVYDYDITFLYCNDTIPKDNHPHTVV